MKGVFEMADLKVNLSDGTVLRINAGDSIEEVRAKFGEDAATIFEGIDSNPDGRLDAQELIALKTRLTDNNYTVEVAQDGKTPKRAYNDAVQNMRRRYDADSLKGNFKQEEVDKYPVESGNTLWKIAKDILEEEGLPTDARSINNRIAQIANLNGLNDVNNIRVGMKLIYKLTPEAVQKVKDADGDSAAAFGGTVRQNPPAGGGAPTGGRGTDTVSVENPVSGKESTITVTANGLNMGKGKPVDKDGNELANFKDPKFAAGGYIMKYTSGDKVMYQITRKKADGKLGNEVKLSAASIEELKELDKKFHETAIKVKAPAADETEEQTKARKAENLAALKELVTLTNGNIQVIRNVAAKLRDGDYVDITSEEYKAFVQDLLLTRNADVINAVIRDDNIVYTAVILEKDKTAHETLAGMYQEIRAKEKAGEKLSDEEIKLKSSLASLKGYNGYKVDADTQNGVHEKYMSYFNMDGIPIYQIEIENNWYYAKDPKLLDEFLTKLESADTNEKKSALFKEYINTQDTGLAKCLAQNVKTLKAKDEDIISLVKANGMEVLATLPTPYDEEVTYSEDVFDAVFSRAKEIVTEDRGNLEKAVSYWINNSGKTDEEKDKIRTEILETYFEVTQDEEGNKTYTFNPSRRPTYEEMYGLTSFASDSSSEAIVTYTKLEDMGQGQYNEAIERWYAGTYTVPHYAEMVDKMTTKEEVIDFIDNKVVCSRDYHLPYDKILEKFPDDTDIKARLFENVDNNSTLSPENAKKFIDMYGKDKLDKIVKLKYKNADAARARIGQLVSENASDTEFIKKVMGLNKSLIPFGELEKIDALKAKWDDKTKAAVFEKYFNDCVLVKDRAKYLDAAVKNHWAQKIADDKYAIGDTIYKTDGHYTGADNKAGTEDDTVCINKISKTGYERGYAMFNELDGAGSGDIAKMLRGKKEEGYENYITPDNVTGIIVGFNTASPNEGLMEYIANEWGWSSGEKPKQDVCNNIPRALIAKAKALNIDASEFAELEKFINEHNSSEERYSTEDAKQLDSLIDSLVEEVIGKSGV